MTAVTPVLRRDLRPTQGCSVAWPPLTLQQLRTAPHPGLRSQALVPVPPVTGDHLANAALACPLGLPDRGRQPWRRAPKYSLPARGLPRTQATGSRLGGPGRLGPRAPQTAQKPRTSRGRGAAAGLASGRGEGLCPAPPSLGPGEPQEGTGRRMPRSWGHS